MLVQYCNISNLCSSLRKFRF